MSGCWTKKTFGNRRSEFVRDPVSRLIRTISSRVGRCSPVLNRSQQLVGMVALGDLAVHAGTQPVAAEVLEQVSEPGTSRRK